MTTVEKTMLTFGIFVLNLYLVLTVHQGLKDEQQVQLIFTITTLVFLTAISIAVYQRDPSYFFGILALYYCPFIIMKTGWSLETGAALIATTGMIHGLAGFPRPRWPEWASFRFLTVGFGRRRLVKRLLSTARARVGAENLSDKELLKFAALENDIGRIKTCFDGSDPALEEALQDTLSQIGGLQGDHARLLLRGAHLNRVLQQSDPQALELEISTAEKEATETRDAVAQGQIREMVGLKQKRLHEMDNLVTCKKRIEVQRAQIIELVKGTFETVNSLKFADIRTLQASRGLISKGISRIRGELESLEEGLLTAETLGQRS